MSGRYRSSLKVKWVVCIPPSQGDAIAISWGVFLKAAQRSIKLFAARFRGSNSVDERTYPKIHVIIQSSVLMYRRMVRRRFKIIFRRSQKHNDLTKSPCLRLITVEDIIASIVAKIERVARVKIPSARFFGTAREPEKQKSQTSTGILPLLDAGRTRRRPIHDIKMVMICKKETRKRRHHAYCVRLFRW